MIKIYTIADKSPQFIGWQAKSFKDYLKDDFEFIVMNNSSSLDLDEAIQGECLAAGIKWINVENKDFSHPCFSCAAPVQETVDRFIAVEKECISVIIDSDMFLIRDFSFIEYIEGYDIAGVSQARDAGHKMIEYIWNGLIVFTPTLPNLQTLDMGCGVVWKAHGDVGLFSYYYLLANPEVKWKRIPNTSIITNHPETMKLFPDHARDLYEFRFDSEIIEGSFFHARGMSRWDCKPKEFYEDKENFIKKLVGI